MEDETEVLAKLRAQPRVEGDTLSAWGFSDQSVSPGSVPWIQPARRNAYGKSLAALKHFYRELGAKTWGIYRFYDHFNQTQNWFETVWMGLNQATINVIIANRLRGLVWRDFMANPENQQALDEIGFTLKTN